MKVEVKKLDSSKRELKFEVPKEKFLPKLEDAYKEIGKRAKVKGFRPGKVPRQVLEAHYGDVAREEAVKKLIPEVYQEALKKEKIIPLDVPDIKDVSLNDGILRFTAILDIRPEVIIKDYKGIKIKRKSSEVTDEELEKTMEYIKKGHGLKDEDQMDDSFAHKLGYANLDEFKKILKNQMSLDKDRHNRADVEQQIINYILKKAKLSVPQSFINKHIERRISEWEKKAKSENMSAKDINEKKENMRKILKEQIEKEIKIFLIFEKIAEQENIEIKDDNRLVPTVMEFLLKEANWQT